MEKKLTLLIFLLLLSVIIIGSVGYFALQVASYVSGETMKSYAQAFVSAYDQDISFFNQTERSSFYLYSNNSYDVKSFISSSYGAAILLTPSTSWSFENNNVEQRVEQAVFGGDFTMFPMFETPPNAHDVMIEAVGAGEGNGTVTTNGGPFLELGYNSSVIIESLTVNSVFLPLRSS